MMTVYLWRCRHGYPFIRLGSTRGRTCYLHRQNTRRKRESSHSDTIKQLEMFNPSAMYHPGADPGFLKGGGSILGLQAKIKGRGSRRGSNFRPNVNKLSTTWAKGGGGSGPPGPIGSAPVSPIATVEGVANWDGILVHIIFLLIIPLFRRVHTIFWCSFTENSCIRSEDGSNVRLVVSCLRTGLSLDWL